MYLDFYLFFVVKEEMTSCMVEKEMTSYMVGEEMTSWDGGEGSDILTGGKGADTFICDSADTITDYNSAEGDKIIGQCSVVDESFPEPEPESPIN